MKLVGKKMRDVSYMKPKGFEDWLTLSELARAVERDPSWLRKLEREERIPAGTRKQMGEIQVRLWSPKAVEEIREILAHHRPGRPSK